MEFLMGAVTQEELQELRRRGWEDEDPPPGYGHDGEDGEVFRLFFVDNDLFKIMSGPDWDLGEKTKELKEDT